MSVAIAQFAPLPPPADAPGWVFFATATVMLASLAGGLWLMLRIRRGTGGGPADPACGACGYLVRGLSTFTCPECGADLRDAGIVTRGKTGRSAAPAVIWVALCAVGGVFLLSIVQYKGAPNGNVGQWLGLVFLATLTVALGGGWFIDSWAHRAGGPASAASVHAPQPVAPPASAVSRTLSVMFIDMAGYTARSASATRNGLIELIRRTRALVEPAVLQRRGRIVKTMGDGFLVTFESATDAVLAGREIQKGIAATAPAGPPDSGDARIELRIGISTGEVALEADDVYGEPVNLASRIQELAGPGEVLFSESTRHAMTRSEVEHEPAGEFELKGFAGRVNVYRAK